jgi:two-component sensor histidine kinase
VRSPSSRRYSTRFHLVGLVAAVVVPLMAFAALVVFQYARAEQARVEQEAVRIAGQTGLLVEADLRQLIATLEGLASSSALAADNIEQFHAEARLLTDGREETIILRDPGVRQLLNSHLPFGTPLPSSPPFSADESTSFARGYTYVSDVYFSPRNNEPRIAVALPIMRDGTPKYVIGMTIPTLRIRDALISAVPPGYIVAVGDRKGAYVARSASHEEVTGKPGLPEYVAQVVGRSGSFRSPNREGVQLFAGYYRSSVTGWFFTANIPVATLERPLRTSLLQLAGFGVGAFALSCLLALLFSRSIDSAAGDLAEQARVLGGDGEATPVRTHLSEFARISDALVGASQAITMRAKERERAEAHRRLLVNELNHRVKNSLTIAQSIASQTLRSAKSIGEAQTALSSRLVSLARTHDVLTRENWEGAEVGAVVAHIVEPYAAPERVDANGETVRLLPGPALTLSLLLHELLTNSAKYGAMSVESGTVRIRWRLLEAGQPRLSLTYEERGGPPVSELTHRGFGSRLFAASFASPAEGSIVVDYPSGGAVCRIEMAGVAAA